MYISNELSNVSIQWTVICCHEYKRLSRTKWKIDFHYKCGAEMTLDDVSDDMIQCLILGAYNSKKEMKTNISDTGVSYGSVGLPIDDWKTLQPLMIS